MLQYPFYVFPTNKGIFPHNQYNDQNKKINIDTLLSFNP